MDGTSLMFGSGAFGMPYFAQGTLSGLRQLFVNLTLTVASRLTVVRAIYRAVSVLADRVVRLFRQIPRALRYHLIAQLNFWKAVAHQIEVGSEVVIALRRHGDRRIISQTTIGLGLIRNLGKTILQPISSYLEISQVIFRRARSGLARVSDQLFHRANRRDF